MSGIPLNISFCEGKGWSVVLITFYARRDKSDGLRIENDTGGDVGNRWAEESAHCRTAIRAFDLEGF